MEFPIGMNVYHSVDKGSITKFGELGFRAS